MAKPRVNPGRVAAVQVLLAVEDGEHVEDALARLAPADAADRALAWNLALGVLRRRSGLDAILVKAARRALRTVDPVTLAVLRMAIYERRFTRVPAHATVDQAVEVAKAAGVGHAAGFVNAVLRHQDGFDASHEEWLGHPPWLQARWRARHGAAADVWMEANNKPAPVYLVAKEDPAGVARDFQHRVVGLTPVGGDVFQLQGPGAIPELPGFAEGRWWVMDPAAVAVADLVGECPPGTEVLDACAAPGGKSFRLAARGLQVTATDVDAGRLARVREGATRLGLALTTDVHDWVSGPRKGTFDVVLVDAPCTGLGTLRRHPDIRWRRHLHDVTAAASRQRAILANAAQVVRPGGVLVYAVCSPEPEEGAEVVRRLGWPIEASFDNAPGLEGQDVFWAVRMRRPTPA